MPQRVGFIRDGMFITTGTHSKLPSLRVFRNAKEFIAVVECESKEGQQLLREMEPPEHDAIVHSRVENGQALLARLGKNIKNQLDKLIKIELSSTQGLDFTADLFNDAEEDAESRDSSSADLNPMARSNGKPKRLDFHNLSSKVLSLMSKVKLVALVLRLVRVKPKATVVMTAQDLMEWARTPVQMVGLENIWQANK